MENWQRARARTHGRRLFRMCRAWPLLQDTRSQAIPAGWTKLPHANLIAWDQAAKPRCLEDGRALSRASRDFL